MSIDKYGTGNDPYCYPDSDVLRNLLGIKDDKSLQRAEEEFTELAAADIEFESSPYDLDYFKTLHQQVFEDVYEWAGELRTIDLSKGSTRFCNCNRIVPEANKQFDALAQADNFIGYEREELVEAVAEMYIELNMAHPFREGNGRVQRILFEHIIINCGYEFDLAVITQDEWIEANVAGVSCDYVPMIALFERCIGDRFD